MLEKPITHIAAQPVTQDTQVVLPAPLVRELPADLETPVSVYLKLAGQSPSFLLESVTGGEQLARYSFIGVHPTRAYVLRGGALETHDGGQVKTTPLAPGADPLDGLRAELAHYRPADLPGLPRFAGGLVGYLSYEMIRYFEPSVPAEAHPELPDGIFLLADTVVAFDHAFGRLVLIANIFPDERGEEAARRDAEQRLDAVER